MEPERSEPGADVQVRTAGLCAVCGQEQLVRLRPKFANAAGGLSLTVQEFTDCGCGVHLRAPESPSPP